MSLLLLAACLLTVSPGAASAQTAGDSIWPGYTFEILTTPTPGTSVGESIGPGGVAGSCRPFTGALEPCLWQGGAPTQLGLPYGTLTGVATAVNAAGIVVGYGSGATGERAFRYDGALIELAPLGGVTTVAYDINDHGLIVGASSAAPGGYLDLAVVWGQSGQPRSLGTLGGPRSQATAINERGWIVGHSQTATSNKESAFLYRNGKLVQLPAAEPAARSIPLDLNEEGLAVGISRIGTVKRAARWKIGSAQLLPLPASVVQSSAEAINDHGQIVGNAIVNGPRPYLWQNGQSLWLKNLVSNSASWGYEEAKDIDNDGRITGWGRLSGSHRAFLLTPLSTNLDRDEDVDRDDIALFRAAYVRGDELADMTGDGKVNRRDVIAFLRALRAGV